ncbi:MAG: DUF721 domain-containing protein [Verrucomicrobiota bacterium]|nr:DUF721 domain-containing protein [Verrucomicrobiota bacterium]
MLQRGRREAIITAHLAALKGIPWIEQEKGVIWREPKGAGDLCELILERYKVGQPHPQAEIVRAWVQVVGARHAGQCTPVRITPQNALVIAVNNPIVRRELQFQERSILSRVRMLPGCGPIVGIEWRAG